MLFDLIIITDDASFRTMTINDIRLSANDFDSIISFYF